MRGTLTIGNRIWNRVRFQAFPFFVRQRTCIAVTFSHTFQRLLGESFMPPFLYLASQSPRRRQLLEQIHVRYELLLPDATEDAEALGSRAAR